MKNRRAIIFLFTANIISGIAQGISMIAIPWYFARQTAMSTFGIFFISISVASIFWSPYSGTLIDRYSRKKIFLIINVISGICLLTVSSFGYINDGLSPLVVGLVFCMTTLNYNIHYPNMYAFVQEITEPSYFGKITSYLEIQNQTSSVIAGALAAFLLEGATISSLGRDWIIQPWPIHKIFLADGLTYFAAFFFISKMSYQSLTKRDIDHGSFVQRLRTGFQFLNRKREIFWFGLPSYAVFICVLICTFFLFATYVKNHLHAAGDVYALSEITYAVGAVTSGFLIRKVFKRFTIPSAIIYMTLAMSLGFLALFFSKSIFLFVVITALLGLTNAGTRILRVMYLFRAIPNAVFGRSMSVFYIAHTLFRILFLSIFSLAFFTEGAGIVFACLVLAGFLLISGIILLYLYSKFDLTKVRDS